jgi:hypothetical protein
MSQSEVAIDYHLIVRSASSIGPSAMRDAAQYSPDGMTRLPSIPGSAIKGRLRWAAEAITTFLEVPACAGPAACQLGPSCGVCGVFGNARFESPFVFTHAELPASLTDLASSLPSAQQRVRRRTDNVALEAMPSGLVYVGTVQGWLTVAVNPDQREPVLPASLLVLIAAFGVVDGIGGGRSVGLGSAAFAIDGVSINGARLTGAEALGQLDRLQGASA